MIINLKNRKKDNSWLSSTMTDISFLLIVFFLITAVFVSDIGLKLNLPELDSEPTVLQPDEVILVNLGIDELVIDNNKYEKDKALSIITNRVNNGCIDTMIITVDKSVDYQSVLEFLDLSKSIGVVNFSIKSSSSDIIPVDISEDDE